MHVRRLMIQVRNLGCKLQIKHLNIHQKVEMLIRIDDNSLLFFLYLNSQSCEKAKKILKVSCGFQLH